jgi:hypothetical protein
LCEKAREKHPSPISTVPVAEFLLIDPRITEGGVVDGPERTNKSHSKKKSLKMPAAGVDRRGAWIVLAADAAI